jgi:hypothetical protein
MNKHFLLFIVLLFITTLNISVRSDTNKAIILEGAWEVIAFKEGDMVIDELMIKESGREVHIIIEKNMILFKKIENGNITDEKSEKIEIINNIIQFDDGTSASYTVEGDILTLAGLGRHEGLVIICRKLN